MYKMKSSFHVYISNFFQILLFFFKFCDKHQSGKHEDTALAFKETHFHLKHIFYNYIDELLEKKLNPDAVAIVNMKLSFCIKKIAFLF